MGKGPKGCTVKVVDHAVAIGPDKRQVTRRFDQRRFQHLPFRPRFAKARRVAHNSARTPRGQLRHSGDGGGGWHGEKGGIGGFGQVGHAGKARVAAKGFTFGVHGPDLACKPDPLGLVDRHFSIAPADKGDVARRQQAREVLMSQRRHAP